MIFEKKVPFATLFLFFINVFFSFRSNLKCMDEVNYFFIVDLSLFLIFNLFLLFFFFIRNKVVLLPFFFVLIFSDGNHSALHLLHLG